jgi:hypothetical protein
VCLWHTRGKTQHQSAGVAEAHQKGKHNIRTVFVWHTKKREHCHCMTSLDHTRIESTTSKWCYCGAPVWAASTRAPRHVTRHRCTNNSKLAARMPPHIPPAPTAACQSPATGIAISCQHQLTHQAASSVGHSTVSNASICQHHPELRIMCHSLCRQTAFQPCNPPYVDNNQGRTVRVNTCQAQLWRGMLVSATHQLQQPVSC